MSTSRRRENENDVCMNQKQTKKLYDSIFCLGGSIDTNSKELLTTEWYENETKNSIPVEMRQNAENHGLPRELHDSPWLTDPKNDYRGLTGKFLSTISEDAREIGPIGTSRDQTARKVTKIKTDKYKARDNRLRPEDVKPSASKINIEGTTPGKGMKSVHRSRLDRSGGKNIKDLINVLTEPTWMKKDLTKPLVYMADNIGSDVGDKADQEKDATPEDKTGLDNDAIAEDKLSPEDGALIKDNPSPEDAVIGEPSPENDVTAEVKPSLEDDAKMEDKPSPESDAKTEDASGLDDDVIVEDEGYLDEAAWKPRWSRDVVESLRMVEHVDDDLSEDEENNWEESKKESTVLHHVATVSEVELRSDEEYEYLDTEDKPEYHFAMDVERPDQPIDRGTSEPRPVMDEKNAKSELLLQPQTESNSEDEFNEDTLSSRLWENEQPDDLDKEHFDQQHYKADSRDWEVPIEPFQPTPQLSSGEMSIGSAIRRRLHPEYYNVTNKWVSEITVESSGESSTSFGTAKLVETARQFKPPATPRIDDDVPPGQLSETVMFEKTVNSLGTYLIEGLQETSKRGRSDPFLFLGRWLLNQADLRDRVEQDLLSSNVDDNL